MVQKRSFYDEETYSISCKHPRQVEYNNELVSFSEFVPMEVRSPRIHAQGESGLTENAIEHHEKLGSEINGRFPISARNDVEDNVPGRSLISSSNIGFNEEASHPRLPVYVSCRSEYFSPSPQHPSRAVTHHEDIYSLLLRYPPTKAVPIGSDHQADIPEWSPQDYKLKTKFSGTPGSLQDARLVPQNDEDRLMGTCVIPMPDLGSVNELENVKIDCCCLDDGSIRCVRQHIVEARDELERTVGTERFEGLGFSVMGEQVAAKWSEEEEQLFYEVVLSNPMSLGRNFWNRLSAVFPSRTKEDIVSYYFNVFMLRMRAEQNRCKSNGIYDSDDDEWQGSDDYNDDELEITEDNGDSIFESPLHLDDHAHIQSKKDDQHTCDRYDADDTSDDRDGSNFLATCPKISFDRCSLTPNYGRMIDGEVQDESCTSSDTGREESDTQWSCRYNGLSYGSREDDEELEGCNVKLWDVECPKIDDDLLSTCSMIEEVFGGGSLK
ncbi:uncharacterized protein [Euphorbia lathyris]|uniref:uncharacterized protein n=1 Tax=Euphorbia lathyris TaxID=212925 RepID=UPI0033131EF4